MYKKKNRYKSQYREVGPASKLPFNGSHVTLISHTRTDCEFHFTAAIKISSSVQPWRDRVERVPKGNGGVD